MLSTRDDPVTVRALGRVLSRTREFWAVRTAAAGLGHSHRDIVSGAGHDAVYASRVVPTSMIFVPCAGGLSHNEAESATPSDLAAGCDVLLNAVLERAGIAKMGSRFDPRD